jgi:hypothetical protein
VSRPHTQVCGKPVTTAAGRMLRPEAGRIILLLRDIHLPRCKHLDTLLHRRRRTCSRLVACKQCALSAAARALTMAPCLVLLFQTLRPLDCLPWPRPDKYATIQLVELVLQLLAHGGYYDESMDFVRLERVQVRAGARSEGALP